MSSADVPPGARHPRPGHERALAEPAFPGDDGSIDSRLLAALGDDTAVLAVLGDVRVFVPVVATLGEDSVPGQGDKDADMAAVLMTGADGRQALMTFSSVEAMTSWNAQARPVPVWGRDAARAALSEGASAILLDLGAPHFSVVESDDVHHLAERHRLVRTDTGTAWVTSVGD